MPSVAAIEFASYSSDISANKSSPSRCVSFVGCSSSGVSSVSQLDSAFKDEMLCRLRHSISKGGENWMQSSSALFSPDSSMASANASSPLPGFYARGQTLVKPSLQLGTGSGGSCLCGLRCDPGGVKQNRARWTNSATNATCSQSEEEYEGRYLRCGGTVARTDSESIIFVDVGTF